MTHEKRDRPRPYYADQRRRIANGSRTWCSASISVVGTANSVTVGRAAAQNVADCFDGKLKPDNGINKEVLGLAQPGPLSGVKRV